jgi:molybdopterin synthase catalytic subunit
MNELLRVTPEPLDVPSAVRRALAARGDGRDGAVATFVGLVRGEHVGRRVVALEYEVYAPLATRTFAAIAAEVAENWPSVQLVLDHRVGRLAVGEPSVVIVAASPHRAEAFGACRYAIERVKQVAPIWKREIFEDGEDWVEGATADLADEAARELALKRACG